MPLVTEFHIEKRQVRVRWLGTVSDDDFLKADEEFRSHPEFDPTFDQLIDLREAAGGDLSREGILKLASRPPAFAPTSRRAVVVTTDLGFGLARMFEQMRADRAGEIRIFRDFDEADLWLEGGG